MKKLYFLFFILCVNKTYTLIEPVEPPLIRNIKTTLCYMDSTLQCLYQIQPLTDFVLTKGKDFYKPSTISQAYLDFVKEMQESKGTIIEPKEFCVPVFKAFFKGEKFKQEDAAEFLAKLLDQLMDEDVKKKEKYFITDTGKMPINPVSALFTSIWANKITSAECPTSIRTEPFNKLELEIQTFDGTAQYKSLKECLKAFTSKELLTGDNKYRCPSTGKMVDAIKQFVLLESPPYLIITLKRFVLDLQTFTTEKVDTSITFPLKLNLKPYIDKEKLKKTKTSTTYDLISFVQHLGTLITGHYTAYVKHKNQWYYVDDLGPTTEKVNETKIRKVETNGRLSSFDPYILFYKRNDIIEPFDAESLIKSTTTPLDNFQKLANFESSLLALWNQFQNLSKLKI